jgi:ATP adenylyltransferase
MDRLWSPWRLSYVTGATGEASTCIFCDAATPSDRGTGSEGDAHDPLVIARGRLCYVVLNRFPYNSGHLLVAPRRHIATLAESTAEELAELMRFTRDGEIALTEAYRPQGINVGINLGRAAGAGIAGHVHIHLVPRWTGDTNFLSVIGEVRVLPEELGDTAVRLRPIFARLQQSST